LPFARQLGEALAHLHETGFAHRDLYAKHVLVDPRDARITFLDWQRCGKRADVSWDQRWRDLAALHASLPDDLATPRERLTCLRSYLRHSLPGRMPLPLRRQALAQIEQHARRLLDRRSVREQRQTSLPIGSQPLIALQGDALCVSPEFHTALRCAVPGWLAAIHDNAQKGREARSIRAVPGAAGAVLVRRRTQSVRNWLRATLTGKPPVSPELAELALLFRLQRHGIVTPRLLAFGQRPGRLGEMTSFLLTEPPAAIPLDQWLLQSDSSSRGHVVRKAGALLRRLHAAGCTRAEANLAVAHKAGALPGVVLLRLDGIVQTRRVAPSAARCDLARLLDRFPSCTRTDVLRLVQAYLNTPRLDATGRDVVAFLILRRSAR
jgi:hypothetical protein